MNKQPPPTKDRLSRDIRHDNRVYHDLLMVHNFLITVKYHDPESVYFHLDSYFGKEVGLVLRLEKKQTHSPFAELFLTIQVGKFLSMLPTLCSLYIKWTVWSQLTVGMWWAGKGRIPGEWKETERDHCLKLFLVFW